MTKTLKNDVRVLQKPAAFMALAVLAGICGLTSARAAESLSGPVVQAALIGSDEPMAGQSVMTPRGPAVVTGNIGSTMETTTLPGSGGMGLLMSNGNGTSTLIVPGGPPQVVATPR